MIWAPWSAHSREAFGELEQAREYLSARIPGLAVMAAADPGSPRADIDRGSSRTFTSPCRASALGATACS